MFSFKAILISSLCLIITSFICSTSGGKATSIKKLTETAKSFLNRVKTLDTSLDALSSRKNFKTINFKIEKKNITCTKDVISNFITEFEKLVRCTKEEVRKYKRKINKLIKWGGQEVGDKTKRDNLSKYYRNQILPELKIKGDEKDNPKVKKLNNQFKNALKQLMDKIKAIEPVENSTVDTSIPNPNPTTSQEELAN